MRSGCGAIPLKDRVNLEPNEVHVWTVELDTPAGTASGGGELLSPDERQRVAASASGVQARRFAAGRGALRRILAGYLGADPRRLEFAYGPFGKPGLASRDGCHLEFSVAHTGGVGQVAVRRDRPIGIDLEAVRPVDAVVIARRFLSDADADWVRLLIDTSNNEVSSQAPGIIRVEDNGCGMTEDQLRNGWLRISLSLKREIKAAGKTTERGHSSRPRR